MPRPAPRVHLRARLHDPSALDQQRIDVLSGELFGCGHENRCHSIRDDTDYRLEQHKVQKTPPALEVRAGGAFRQLTQGYFRLNPAALPR